MLSTRADLVGPKLAQELTRAAVVGAGRRAAAVRATVVAELGQPIEEVFAQFDDVPLASASIGQVHRARLHAGEQVVVKVQHPGIEEHIRTDLDILVGLAELAETYLPELRKLSPAGHGRRVPADAAARAGFRPRGTQPVAVSPPTSPAMRRSAFPAPNAELSTGAHPDDGVPRRHQAVDRATAAARPRLRPGGHRPPRRRRSSST